MDRQERAPQADGKVKRRHTKQTNSQCARLLARNIVPEPRATLQAQKNCKERKIQSK